MQSQESSSFTNARPYSSQERDSATGLLLSAAFDCACKCREMEEMKAGQAPVEPLDIQLGPQDSLLPCGKVTAILGDQIIVQV